MEISVEKLMQALPLMGKGMLGIFVVTAVIILLVMLLNRLTQPKK
jgi:hypothetical protein